MKKSTEVISLVVANGTKTNSNQRTLQQGNILGICIIKNALNNIGMVQGMVKINGDIIVDLQHIDNLRSREAAYHDSYYPICMTGGQEFSVSIVSDTNFTAATPFDFIFIYEN